MARFALKLELQQEIAGVGQGEYGDVIAVVETNVDDPGVLGRMITYGQVLVKRLQDGEEVVCKSAGDTPKAEAPPEPEKESEPKDDSEPEPDPEPEDDSHPLDALEGFGVDHATIDALKKANIDSTEELIAVIESGEKIKGVGELREKQLRDALPALKKS